jgi:RF-1 domain
MSPTRDHPAALDPDQLAAQCDIRRTRRSGPGGQNRNKVETAVVLVHRPSGIEAEASERRSQAENLRNALFRLRLKLALKIRRPVEADESPSLLWRSRCRGGRIVVSAEHDDFPAILAEALDVLAAHALDLKPSSAALGCTSSQLLKLLRAEPRALLLVNDRRRSAGLHALA